MIIRSQDKRWMANFDNILTIGLEVQRPKEGRILQEYETKIVGYATNGYVDLAVYESEEKAIKVLDMICEYYQECKMCESGRRQIAQVEFVFQMPQDSEV